MNIILIIRKKNENTIGSEENVLKMNSESHERLTEKPIKRSLKLGIRITTKTIKKKFVSGPKLIMKLIKMRFRDVENRRITIRLPQVTVTGKIQ